MARLRAKSRPLQAACVLAPSHDGLGGRDAVRRHDMEEIGTIPNAESFRSKLRLLLISSIPPLTSLAGALSLRF